MAVPVLAAIFLEVNALIILIMITALFLHQATRTVAPFEQHVHSVLEMLPL